MKTVKITCDTGKTWTTSINGTIEEIRAYFFRDPLVIDENCDTGLETRHKIILVEEVTE